MTPKPKSIRVARRGEILCEPVIGADRIFVSAFRDVTVCLDRVTLKPVWKIDSGNMEVGHRFGDVVTVAGFSQVGARKISDGGLVWKLPTAVSGLRAWEDYAAVPAEQAVELRLPASGELVRSVRLPWNVDGVGTVCGEIWIAPSEPSQRGVCGANLASSEVIWQRPLFDEMAPYLRSPAQYLTLGIVPSSFPDRFVATHGNATFGCALADGTILWHADVPVPHYWPNTHNGRVFTLCGNRFVAIDESTGQILYDVRHSTLEPAYLGHRGVAYRERIAIPNESGHLVVLNTEDGSLVSLYTASVALWRAVEIDRRLVVGTGDGTLLVFDESIWGLG